VPYFHVFLWDEVNERHVAAHGVSLQEFEHVVLQPISVSESHSSGRPVAFGYTPAGRKLACVYEVIDEIYCYPVTAYEVP
jgi:uncharacterized DUF497 family protein